MGFNGSGNPTWVTGAGTPQYQITNMKLWKNPSIKVLVADSRGLGIAEYDRWKWIDVLDPNNTYYSYLDGRHSNGANILYADGHVNGVGIAQKPHDLIDLNAWRMDR